MHLETAEAIRQVRLYTIHRREPRYVYTTPVTLQRFLRFGPVVTRAMCLNISLRGMSALVCGAPRVGETVVIELPLRDAPIEMLATVRHSSDARSGFEFYPLSVPDQDGLNDWIREQEKREEMRLPYPDIRAAGFRRSS
ncbi:MAG: PilZ domain-containing protein [Terriglobales bacterium]